MTWRYVSADFHGSKTSPQPGDYVDIHLEDDVDPEAELHQIVHRWTFDGTQTKAQFVTMVKQETIAHRNALNTAKAHTDATSDFDPT